MESLGRHELVELYGCEPGVLDDEGAIRRVMLEAAASSGATVVGERFHKFSPQGVSGVVVLAESHLAVHTWPEHGYAALDLFTCGAQLDTDACFRHLAESLGCRHRTSSVLSRGARAEIARYDRKLAMSMTKR